MGVVVRAKARAAARRVPSPPRTMTRFGLCFGQVDAFDGVGCVDVGGAVGVEEVVVVACFEPRDEIAQDAGDFRLLGLGDDGGLEH